MAQNGAERRMDPRFRPEEGWIDLDGDRFEIRDVSASGILVRPYAGGRPIGSSFTFRLHLRDDVAGEIVIDGGAVVVRSSTTEMAAQFFHLDSDQYPDFDAYLERQFAARISERSSTH